MNNRNLPHDLRIIRNYLNLSQSKLADRLGLSHRTVTALEAGHEPGRTTELRIKNGPDFYLMSEPAPADPREFLEGLARLGRYGFDGEPHPEAVITVLDILLLSGTIPEQYRETVRCIRALLEE